ncbi:imidazole glycerol phosphate synthase subunit HisH [bacterium]|nr:imidazole glycerol phosphate synthase subunit HisH [bacterium]MBU4561553.1 imidazole glycerol phosphate synthase subunit HisH [bacterium]MCG2675954.1 imidazole glycerol phosphate synthase subunit HisH [bacterium]
MIVIVDYGMGNLRSVQKAFQKVGQEALITSDPDKVLQASKVVLPGVGAFGKCIANLKEHHLIDPIYRFIETGKPFLGICLGLQLLFTESEEGGVTGLNIIKGRVKRFDFSNKGLKVPHMGWNQIKKSPKSEVHPSNWQRQLDGPKSVLKGIPDGSYFYFVHSYYVEPDDKSVITATTEYGLEFASIVSKDNIYGTQFHPEKSQELGLRMLKNFGEL